MAILLILLSFVCVSLGVTVQVAHSDNDVRWAVSLTTGIAALLFLGFAMRVFGSTVPG